MVVSDTFLVRLSNGPDIEWSGPDLFVRIFFSASLDRFGMNKIFFMALINKTVYASESGFQMVGTGPFCPVFKW